MAKPINEPDLAASEPKKIDPEEAAQKEFGALLSNAKKLAKARIYSSARTYFERIIREAAGTAIAAEAKRELDGLPKD